MGSHYNNIHKLEPSTGNNNNQEQLRIIFKNNSQKIIKNRQEQIRIGKNNQEQSRIDKR